MKKFKDYLEAHKAITITVLLVLIIAIMTFTTVISYNLLYDYNHDESMYNYNHDKSMDDVVLEPNQSTTKKTSYTYYNQTKEYSLTLDNEENTYTYKICTNAKCNYYIGIWKQEEHLLILSVESIYDMNDCYYSNDWEVAAFNFKVNGNTLVTTNDIKLTKTKKTLDDNVTKPTTNCIYKDFTVDSESIIGAYFYEDSAKKDNFNNNTYRYELVLFADDTFIYAQCGSVTCGAYSGTYKMGSNKIILQADKRYGSDDTYKETNETISFNINKDSSISVTDNKTLINLITTKFSNLSTIESYYGSPYFRHNELFKSAETNKETISLKVTFDENGGSDVADLKIENGNKISTPIPYKKGYYFTGWYLNDKEWDDENLVTNDITLKAHWSDLMFVSDPNQKSNPFTTNEVLEKGTKVITHKYFSIYEL